MMSADDNDTERPYITQKEWIEKIKQAQFAKRDFNKLIMNFFLIEVLLQGYKEAAENFKKESGTDISSMDLTFMQERLDIRSMIHDGNLNKAIDKVKDIDSKLLDENMDLSFTLQLQKLIELIKQNNMTEALDFAQKEIAPFIEKNEKYVDQVERVMSLLAYEDPSKSNLSDLVENAQKIKVASEVNHELLRAHSKETDSKLSVLLRMILWSQNRLKERTDFPDLKNLASAEFTMTNK